MTARAISRYAPWYVREGHHHDEDARTHARARTHSARSRERPSRRAVAEQHSQNPVAAAAAAADAASVPATQTMSTKMSTNFLHMYWRSVRAKTKIPPTHPRAKPIPPDVVGAYVLAHYPVAPRQTKQQLPGVGVRIRV